MASVMPDRPVTPERLYSPAEIAGFIGCAPETIRAACRSGRLRCRRVESKLYIPWSAVDELWPESRSPVVSMGTVVNIDRRRQG